MTKTMLTLWTFFAFVAASASALQCFEHSQITCGDHDAIYDSVCEVYDNSVTDPIEVTCPDMCGTVTVTQSYQGDFEINVVLASCLAATTGCLDKEQLEALDPALTQQIDAYAAAGITTERIEACSCDTNLCNSAINLTGRLGVLLPIILVALKALLLG